MSEDWHDHDETSSLIYNRVTKPRLAAASLAANLQKSVDDLKLKKQTQEDTLKLVLARMKEEQVRLALEG